MITCSRFRRSTRALISIAGTFLVPSTSGAARRLCSPAIPFTIVAGVYISITPGNEGGSERRKAGDFGNLGKEEKMAVTTETEPTGLTGEGGFARYFELARYKVTVGSEVMAGVTTFLVMAYIAFVNPIILTSVADRSGFKLDFGATVTATCWVSSFLCILMGVYARRPFAMAPGMGLNAVVTYQLVAAQGLSWSQAMGIIVLEGIIITLLVLTKFRQAIMDAVPLELKRAIAAGIGLFILYIGLNEAGLVSGNAIFAKDPTAPPVA